MDHAGTLVMKFGGSLTADARSIRRIGQIILAEALAWRRMVVVVSAMAGATDTLLSATELAAARDGAGYRQAIARLRAQHVDVIAALFGSAALQAALLTRLDGWLFEALAVCDAIAIHREATPRERDAVMAVGERLMTEIVLALVQQDGVACAWVDSAQVMITDEHHQNANPITELVEERAERILAPLLEAGMVALLSGFIGATRGGAMTTLGRGGSDYSATVLAAALAADEVWMWTHVAGIMSADPSLVPNARVIEALSYDEIRELSYFGTRVLHPRAIEPLLARSIPMRVRNPFQADQAGTLIQARPSAAGLKAVSATDGLLISTRQAEIDLPGFLAQVDHLLGGAATGPVLAIQGQGGATFVFVVPTSEGPTAAANATLRLAASFPTPRWTVQTVKVIAAPGGTRLSGLTPLAFAQGQADRCLYVVRPEDTQSTVRQLHRGA